MNLIVVLAAKYLYLIVVVAALVVFLLAPKVKKKLLVKIGLIALPLALVLSLLASYFINDPRPFVVEKVAPLIPHTADNGFPSDHTLLAAALAAIIFVYNRKWGIVLGTGALLVGLARVAAKVHHLTDIVGSVVIAALATYVAWWFTKKYLSKFLP